MSASRYPSELGPDDWTDAWVLAAIADAGATRGADLSAVIVSADWMNHAILTPEEVDHAAARFVPMGLLEVHSDRYVVTPAGWRLCRDASVPWAGPMSMIERLNSLVREYAANSK